MPSRRTERFWNKIGSIGRAKSIRQQDKDNPRYWIPKRIKRWFWKMPD